MNHYSVVVSNNKVWVRLLEGYSPPTGPWLIEDMHGFVHESINVRNMPQLAQLTGKTFSRLFDIIRDAKMDTDYIELRYPKGKPHAAIFRDHEGNDVSEE